MVMRPLNHRSELPAFLDELGLVGRGAEVGVAEGFFAKEILDNWKGCKHLSLIDVWDIQDPAVCSDLAELGTEGHQRNYRDCLQRLQPHLGRYTAIRNLSTEAAKFLPDASLVFVYLDADHSERAVWEDLKAYWPKLKPGGIFSGHDYVDPPTASIGVKKAVDEFSVLHGRQLYLLDTPPGGNRSWMFMK